MLTLHQAGLTTTPTIAPLDGTIRPGELLAIVGPNGCGKTTLIEYNIITCITLSNPSCHSDACPSH